MPFRISGLPAETFAPLFALSDTELASQGGVRQVAQGTEPCRISLTDAAPGDELLLVNFEHHPVASPYRGRYAVFVRPGEQRFDSIGSIPDQLRRRTLAARAFDACGMSIAVELVEGQALEQAIERQLGHARTAYIHLHYAAAGCYAARVGRVSS